ncbi:MAG: proline--tRNA ligase [Bdellovibrionota bacterium]
MKWSKTHIFTLREAPADAELASHKLLMRGGYVKKIAPGIFVYNDLALRVIRKIEQIVRKEMNKYATEILMPMVQPRELWDETKRWSQMSELLKFKNRADQWFCLGGTHEEVVTDVVRTDVKSYRDLPKFLYQIQTKYRDEIRPRYGLMRAREFIMKDAYSFDTTVEDAHKSYDHMYTAYNNIYKEMGLDFRVVQADAGNIGGSKTHEFQVLAEAGEDYLLVAGDAAYNVEIAPLESKLTSTGEAAKSPEEFATPGLKTIDDLSKSLNVKHEDLVKTLFVKDDDGKPICILLRGSDELNPVKVKNLLKLGNPPEFMSDEEVKQLTGASPGSCGPQGLKLRILMDSFLKNRTNFTVGANKDGYHTRNINPERDFKVTHTADLRLAKEGDLAPNGQLYKAYKGIEVGHIFYLGTKYSEAMKANYLDKNGRTQSIEMGCYGIGVSRTMQAAIEQNHDANGIIWPKEISPYQVHIAVLDPKDEKVMAQAQKLHDALQERGHEVLLDDRDERPGIKFKDADLLGFPIRVNIGKKGLENNEVDLVIRKTGEQTKMTPDQIYPQILEILK